MAELPHAPIGQARARIAEGGMVIVVDDAERENEGDLVIAAEKITPEAVNFMARFGRGLICVAIVAKRLEELDIGPMVASPSASTDTNFTVSIDLDVPRSTGISAYDRAHTIARLLSPEAAANDFRRPGHVFPLRYTEGGVLRRPGHTEAAVDLARLAGLYPAGVICEIMGDDGTMARLPELREFADRHRLPLISIADIIAYRRRCERLVPGREGGLGLPKTAGGTDPGREGGLGLSGGGPQARRAGTVKTAGGTIRRVAETHLPTPYGSWRVIGYESLVDGLHHLALAYGDTEGARNVLVRVHSECLTGDVFRSRRCDCGAQLDLAMASIAEEGRGVVVYLRGHEGRGIGLIHKLQAYQLQDDGSDTVDANLALGLPADSRSYGTAAMILADLGLSTLRLLTNNPAKRAGIAEFGLEIVDRVPLQVRSNPANALYLATKQEKLGHVFTIADERRVDSTGVGDLARQSEFLFTPTSPGPMSPSRVVCDGLAFAPGPGVTPAVPDPAVSEER
ncbi:MAG: GTP cyclohydrolase II [Nitriliruptorales bacterium]